MAGGSYGLLGVELHQPVKRGLGQDAQEIAIIALLNSGQALGQCRQSSDSILSWGYVSQRYPAGFHR